MKVNNILVTGCGGDIGLSIGKILKRTRSVKKIFGMDINYRHPGKFIFNDCFVSTETSNPKYIFNLKKIISKLSIDLVIPTSDQEIRFFYKNNFIDSINGIPIIMTNKKSLEVGLDKYNTFQFLKKNDLPYPWTYIIKQHYPDKFPCIIKARYGKGSSGVYMVDEDLYKYYKNKRKDDLVQEYLEPNDQEYTCCIFRSRTGFIRIIIIKRLLLGGLTGYGQIQNNHQIESLLTKIAKLLNLKGSLNVQLRLTKRGPFIFEINPRFSSTVLFRHLLGFKDLVWCLDEVLGKKPGNYNPPKNGTEFYRGSYEYIVKK